MKVDKISDNVWKFTGTDHVNIYYIDAGDDKIIIDAGNRADRQQLLTLLGNLIDLREIDIVIFTHLHYDHIGNFDIFPNAQFYASAKEIADYNHKREEAVLNPSIVDKFSVDLKPLPERIGPLDVVEVPGHTAGSVCLMYPEKKILFSGDTMFSKKQLGRTDLPTSAPGKLNDSLIKLLDYDFKTLAPGHDY
ncbi:MBL fold metallo-hydrolase [Candidatus Woesearchaeota archaeon]|nr:MBL fold metallo-hydrolase [Candidatus Woesearchaeota archaeon]